MGRWHSREPVPRGSYWDRHSREESSGHHHHHHHHYHHYHYYHHNDDPVLNDKDVQDRKKKKKKTYQVVCGIEGFVESPICKLRMMLLVLVL